MRFLVTGFDSKSGDEVELEVSADSIESARELAKSKFKVFPTDIRRLDGDSDGSVQNPARRYPAILALSAWCRSLAYICGGAGFVGVVIGLVMIAENRQRFAEGLAVALGSAFLGAATVVSLLAYAEGMVLMIDIEATLRRIARRPPKREPD